jgi:hypothetical protein
VPVSHPETERRKSLTPQKFKERKKELGSDEEDVSSKSYGQ